MKGMQSEMKKPQVLATPRASEDNVINDQEENVMSKNITATAEVIPFRQSKLLLVNHEGQPFVPMRPVVQGMGMDWASQFVKLQGGRFKSTVVEITMVAEDGKQRAMTCLPLRKLTGWLMSIHPNKVRPELRDGIIAYQNECDDVLWSYWSDGIAARHDDRTVETVLNQTLGTDGFRCLAAVLDGKVRHLPAKNRQRAKMHVWSQVHKAFSVVSAEDIPASQLDAARNFIAAYAIEGEWIGREQEPRVKGGTFADILGRPMTPSERWVVYSDSSGNEQHSPIPYDACILTHRDLIKGMLEDIPVSTDEMFEFVMAAVANLKVRHDSQAGLVKAGRAAA